MITETRSILSAQRRRMAQLAQTINQSEVTLQVRDGADIEKRRQMLFRVQKELNMDHERVKQVFNEQMEATYNQAKYAREQHVASILSRSETRDKSSATAYGAVLAEKKKKHEAARKEYGKRLEGAMLTVEKVETEKSLKVQASQKLREARLQAIEEERIRENQRREEKCRFRNERRNMVMGRVEQRKAEQEEALLNKKDTQAAALARKAIHDEEKRQEISARNERKREVASANARATRVTVNFIHHPGQRAEVQMLREPGDYDALCKEQRQWTEEEEKAFERSKEWFAQRSRDQQQKFEKRDIRVSVHKETIEQAKANHFALLEARRKDRYDFIEQKRNKDREARLQRAEENRQNIEDHIRTAAQRRSDKITRNAEANQERWSRKTLRFFTQMDSCSSEGTSPPALIKPSSAIGVKSKEAQGVVLPAPNSIPLKAPVLIPTKPTGTPKS